MARRRPIPDLTDAGVHRLMGHFASYKNKAQNVPTKYEAAIRLLDELLRWRAKYPDSGIGPTLGALTISDDKPEDAR